MSIECVVFIIGVIIQISSMRSWPQFAVGRLISGLGVGALSAAVPMVSARIFLSPETISNAATRSIKQKQRLHKFVVP